MDLKGIREFWGAARKHPTAAILLLLAWAVTTIGWEVIHPHLLALFQPAPPFANMKIEYTGAISDSGPFTLCLETREVDPISHKYNVRGTMTFDSGAYVDYWGSGQGSSLDLSYTRGTSAAPDTGKATFYAPVSKGAPLTGFYQSSIDRTNRQDLTLRTTGRPCELNGWDHGH